MLVLGMTFRGYNFHRPGPHTPDTSSPKYLPPSETAPDFQLPPPPETIMFILNIQQPFTALRL